MSAHLRQWDAFEGVYKCGNRMSWYVKKVNVTPSYSCVSSIMHLDISVSYLPSQYRAKSSTIRKLWRSHFTGTLACTTP